jgi:hypothetical protein
MAGQYQLNNSLNNYHQIQNQIILQWINYCLFYMCISSQWEITYKFWLDRFHAGLLAYLHNV